MTDSIYLYRNFCIDNNGTGEIRSETLQRSETFASTLPNNGIAEIGIDHHRQSSLERFTIRYYDVTVFELTRFIHIETFASTPNNETAEIISNLRSTSNVATIGMFYDSILRCHVLETFLDSTLIMEPPGSKFGSIINSVSFSNTGIAQHRTADKRTKG